METEEPEDHEQLADQLEAEADKLARETARLAQEIDDVRTDWHAKQADPGVPGAAEPLDQSASEDPPGRRSST
jgi:hypothetical protein